MSDATSRHANLERRDIGYRTERAQVLTCRQLEVLAWVQEGKSAWEIGQILGISGRSVDGHLRRVYEAFDVHTRLQAVLKAQDLGLLARPGSIRGGN